MTIPWLWLAAATLVTAVSSFAAYRLGRRRAPKPDDQLQLVNELLNREIERRNRSERERASALEELEARQVEMERFTYTVSHDLKSPLVTIRGFLGVIEQDLAAGRLERVTGDLKRIDSASRHMSRLLDELLELSRVGRLANPSQAVPMGELAREVIELLAGRIAAGGVEVDVAPDLPVVFGDRPRLLEMLQNLVENAIKFMDDQPRPRIEIGGRRQGTMAKLFVRDNGIGIDDRYRQRIFGLFERLDPSREEGTGIGLALVQRIAELHGGRVWVESPGPGRGSTFFFLLPLADAAPQGSGVRQ